MKTKLKYKRRGILLYLLSVILTSIFLFYKPMNYFIIIINFILVPFANLLLLPFEKSIQKKYLKLAREKLKRINPLVIGITGSFGKTTFKEYLYSLLKNKYRTYKSTGNYNTLMGLTKFINQDLNEDCEVLILEIGIDENHGIKKYKSLTLLDIAIITGVGKVHLSTFKKYENIINSKCEIETLLKENGMLFFNANYQEIINYHFKSKTTPYYLEETIGLNINLFQKMAVSGVKKVGEYLSVEEKYFTYFLNNLPIVKRRFEITKKEDALIINDSYNINEKSLEESINYLKSFQGIKIIITGGLIELGKEFYPLNYALGLKMKDIDYLFLITNNKKHPLAKAYSKNNGRLYVFNSLKKCEKIISEIKGYKIILISAKGSDYFLK